MTDVRDIRDGTMPPREARIAAMILGSIGAVMGGASAVATLFARNAPDFTVVPESLAAGLFILALSVLAAVAAGEAAAHPKAAGAVMFAVAVIGFSVLRVDYAIAAALLGMAGIIALVEPPAHPHHDLPRALRLGS